MPVAVPAGRTTAGGGPETRACVRRVGLCRCLDWAPRRAEVARRYVLTTCWRHSLKVLITGGAGMLGRALTDGWRAGRPRDVVFSLNRGDGDLRDESVTREILGSIRPDLVLHSAARVGGIAANIASPVEYLSDNLRIDSNVINAARASGVSKLVYFGSSCMYPADHRQPLVEDDMMAGPLERTNEGYAIAKIAGSRLCHFTSLQYGLHYRTLIPSNLYGPHDHFGSSSSHLVAAAITKAHQAKLHQRDTVDVWGDGTARREFTYVGDLADYLVQHVDQLEDWPAAMNVGIGRDYAVADFYRKALMTVGHEARLDFDDSKPAGMKQKLMDSTVARRHGWDPQTDIEQGMRLAYDSALASGQLENMR